MGVEQPDWPSGTEPEPEPEPRGRWRLGLVGAIGVAGLVLAAVSVVALVRGGTPPHRGGPPDGPVTTAPAARTPASR
ncbi:hypothetical protein [Streptomyces sp. NPDC051909]|uniref:hypothetical protein n=1 Tax=Streptomyces sp. NPDC051909 TaxID=3154944 RepID=UPI003440DCE9